MRRRWERALYAHFLSALTWTVTFRRAMWACWCRGMTDQAVQEACFGALSRNERCVVKKDGHREYIDRIGRLQKCRDPDYGRWSGSKQYEREGLRTKQVRQRGLCKRSEIYEG
jgi:hypothetical protein